MLHFAYGSNMDLTMMRRRCPGAVIESPAVLWAHRFIVMSDGMATVVPVTGERVHGLLWRLGPSDLAALHDYENLDCGLYRAVTKSIATDRGRRLALVYVARSRVWGRPRPGYMELVTAAARSAALPPSYVRTLDRWALAAPHLRATERQPARARTRRSIVR